MIDQPPADGVTPPSDPGAFHPYTLPEAARRLGVGQSTVRRMVKAGKLRAETVLRPQGSAWVVWLPDAPSTSGVEAPDHPPSPGGSARSTDPPHPPAPSAPDALAAWVVTLMAPLAEANQRQHETIVSQAERLERQAEQLVQSAEQRARLATEMEHAKDALGELGRRHEQTVAYARWLLIAVAVLVLAVTTMAVAAVLLPGWPR